MNKEETKNYISHLKLRCDETPMEIVDFDFSDLQTFNIVKFRRQLKSGGIISYVVPIESIDFICQKEILSL